MNLVTSDVLMTNADGEFLEEGSAITDTTVLSQEQTTNDPRASKAENGSSSTQKLYSVQKMLLERSRDKYDLCFIATEPHTLCYVWKCSLRLFISLSCAPHSTATHTWNGFSSNHATS